MIFDDILKLDMIHFFTLAVLYIAATLQRKPMLASDEHPQQRCNLPNST